MALSIQQKQAVTALREQGFGYKTIAAKLQLPVTGVKNFLNRKPVEVTRSKPVESGYCLLCAEVFQIHPQGRQRKFFSTEHRYKWWAANREARKTAPAHTCQHCKATFHEYEAAGRKFCSHACYIKARFNTKGGKK